jgi:hypothetical protein
MPVLQFYSTLSLERAPGRSPKRARLDYGRFGGFNPFVGGQPSIIDGFSSSNNQSRMLCSTIMEFPFLLLSDTGNLDLAARLIFQPSLFRGTRCFRSLHEHRCTKLSLSLIFLRFSCSFVDIVPFSEPGKVPVKVLVIDPTGSNLG